MENQKVWYRTDLINLKSNAMFSQIQNFKIQSEMNFCKNGHGAKDKYLFHVSSESSNQMIQMDSLLVCTQGYPDIASGFFKNNP